MRNIKKILAVSMLSLSLTIGMGLTSWAANNIPISSNQTDRWEGTGDTWKLKDNNGSYVVSSWFQDLDGSWYLIGSDGIMFSGLITDQSTGKTYLLNTNHDGTFGRMLTIDGSYNINGKDVYIAFNQSHDGTFGAITSGLNEARDTGIKDEKLDKIPTDTGKQNTDGMDRTAVEQQAKEWESQVDWSTGHWNDSAGGTRVWN